MNTKENSINVHEYPINASPLEIARFQVAVMEAAERGEPLQFWHANSPTWSPVASGFAWDFGFRYRIARPKIAEGHNPDGLSEEVVGVKDGWRLLSEEERSSNHGGRNGHPAFKDEIECWRHNHWDASGYCGDGTTQTYRTKNPPGYYLLKPEPVKKLFPWTFITAPKGCVLVRLKSQRDMIHPVTSWSPDGLSIGQNGFRTFQELYNEEEFSVDGALTWHPCGTLV